MKKHDIKHHLSKELLLAYSAGQIEEGFSLAIATHISMCDQCRAELESLEAMGGAVFENLEPNEIDVDAFAKTLALIDQTPEETKVKPKATGLPEPLADYVGCNLDDIDWRPIGMGVKQKILVNSEKVSARLLYIPAGIYNKRAETFSELTNIFCLTPIPIGRQSISSKLHPT